MGGNAEMGGLLHQTGPRGQADPERALEVWRPRLARFVGRLAGGNAPVEDLVQEVLARALQAIRARRGGSQLSTWLFGIAANVCREHHRGEARRVAPVDDAVLLEIPDFSVDPARIVERKAEREALTRALDRLDPAHREVLLLRDQGGLTYEEIAGSVGVPVGTVRSRIHNATALLLRLVEEELR